MTVFQPDRTHLIGAAIMALLAVLAVGMFPKFLFWLPLLPMVFAYWVLRSRTTVDGTGITARYAFSQPKSVTWEEFAGLRFGGSTTYARATNDTEFSLPGITFNSLPALSEASQGRIPDALTAGLEAADEKVVVIHRDGRQVLKPKDDS